MKQLQNPITSLSKLLTFLLALGASVVTQGQVGTVQEWPHVFLRDGVTNTIFQPQLQSWDYSTLKAASAVSVQPIGEPQSTFGTIKFVAKTRVDRVQRQVYLEDLQITEADFPSARAQENAYLTTFRSLVPKEMHSISLDRLEASLAILGAREIGTQPLKNDPPAIIFSTTPAMLILVDGTPAYRPVEKTKVERVINTRALIVRDKSGKHYLHLFDGYMEAPALTGPWTIASKVPKDVKKAEKQAVDTKQVDLLAGQENPDTKQMPSLKSTPVPTLYIETVPTELIVTQGEPVWSPIPPTQLLCVTNTSSHIFKELTDQKTYILLSGRWFRSSNFEGPWEYVPGNSLPADFANIPDDSPQENVKASVPGTRQAQEAVIANNIPHTVKVNRMAAHMDPPPQYDGTVQLKPIDGTPLYYVANCPVAVIQVDPHSWYACQNGVWFVATSTTGPWTVATSVPSVIYSIPPSSPMHYVVYARIANYDPTYVWVTTTPGFYGTVVSSDGVVVYGTGYVYPPYIGTTYVSYSVTYGYGSDPCWTPWAGWAFGFAVGWAMASDWYWWCGCPPAPYWGPYWGGCYGAYYNAYGGITAWGPYSWAGTSGYIYHQNGPWTGVSRGAAGYNAWTGNEWASSYGRAYNSVTGTRAVGQRGAVENVYTGNYAYGGRGAFYNQNTGIAGTGNRVAWGNESTGNEGTAGRSTFYNPNTGKITHISGAAGERGGFVDVNGHVIAGHDGNYYRPDGQGGWDQVTRPSQSRLGEGGAGERRTLSGATAGTSLGAGGFAQSISGQSQWHSSGIGQQERQALDREYSARETGAMRQHSFEMNRPSFNRSAGFGGFNHGGGFRGGGFRRR